MLHHVTYMLIISGGGSCLLGSCLIKMADGSEKPIESIQKDDLIIDGNLQPVRVLALVTNFLGYRQLFQFKNGPIFTPEHMFYAAIDKPEIGVVSKEALIQEMPQTEEWNVKPLEELEQLLQYQNKIVSAKVPTNIHSKQ